MRPRPVKTGLVVVFVAGLTAAAGCEPDAAVGPNSGVGVTAGPVRLVPSQIVVRPAFDTIPGPGESLTLGAVVVSSDGSAFAGTAVHWRSLNRHVATVDATSGRVVGVSPGDTRIEAVVGSVVGYAQISVQPPP